jgi:hypothetical protein
MKLVLGSIAFVIVFTIIAIFDWHRPGNRYNGMTMEEYERTKQRWKRKS